jgi:DNA-binding transcriptional regulator YiaG
LAKKKKEEAEPEVLPAPEPAKQPKEENGSFTGERIKRMREQKGLTLKEIAERTKISVAVLQALEDERYEDMPSARVYVRGFVRCLAEEIGLDKDQVSQSYVPRWERWFSESGRRY